MTGAESLAQNKVRGKCLKLIETFQSFQSLKRDKVGKTRSSQSLRWLISPPTLIGSSRCFAALPFQLIFPFPRLFHPFPVSYVHSCEPLLGCQPVCASLEADIASNTPVAQRSQGGLYRTDFFVYQSTECTADLLESRDQVSFSVVLAFHVFKKSTEIPAFSAWLPLELRWPGVVLTLRKVIYQPVLEILESARLWSSQCRACPGWPIFATIGSRCSGSLTRGDASEQRGPLAEAWGPHTTCCFYVHIVFHSTHRYPAPFQRFVMFSALAWWLLKPGMSWAAMTCFCMS